MKILLAALVAAGLLRPSCYAAGLPVPPGNSAASAILVDAESGRVLYEKNAHERRLIASTTKLMTALVAVESTPRLDTVITATEECMAEGSSMYLKPGEELTLRELLYGLLLQSGNDAALAIAIGCAGDVETFVGWMNQWAEDIGMADSHFANPNGLDEEDHYSTAYDLALLGRAVLKSEPLREIMATRSAQVAGRSLTNHNKLLWLYQGCGGMKTGYTVAAGRSLVSCAVRGDQTLICVTLNDPDDWKDHAAMLDYGFAHWPAHLLAREGKTVRSLPVAGGILPQVDVVTFSRVAYPLSSNERVTAQFILPKMAPAPVRKGHMAGKLIFFVNGERVGETYLVYADDVSDNLPTLSFLDRVRALLRSRSGSSSLAVLINRGTFGAA